MSRTNIHHATRKRAANNGLVFVESTKLADGWDVVDEQDGKLFSSALDPKEALEDALAKLDDEDFEGEDQTEGDDSEADDEEEEKLSGSAVKERYKQRYAAAGDPTSCQDDISQVLKSYVTTTNDKGKPIVDMDALAEVATQNGIDLERYEGLNRGMIRMNVGNRLRGLIRNGETVTINGQDYDWRNTDMELTAKAAKRLQLVDDEAAADMLEDDDTDEQEDESEE